MAHEDDGFGAVVAGIFDGGECADDALVVCDLLVGVEGDIEIYLEGHCQMMHTASCLRLDVLG
jgi:hypothetical protein